jgi:ribonuclease P protein subunit POP4
MMKITPSIIQQSFLGLKASVVKSSNPSNIGISGTVIDETRNTFVIRNHKKKTVVKSQAIFSFTFPDTTIVEIEGRVLVGRPEVRLKRRIRRLW